MARFCLHDIQTFVSNLCWIVYNKFLYFAGRYSEHLSRILVNTRVHRRNTIAKYLSEAVCSGNVYKLVVMHKSMLETKFILNLTSKHFLQKIKNTDLSHPKLTNCLNQYSHNPQATLAQQVFFFMPDTNKLFCH